MQTINDVFGENQKKTNGRPKSSTRYPKQMPSYIVAFALQETYDDIATAQQMICNKKSLQGSTNSVSPTISSKTITLDYNPATKLPDPDYNEVPNERKNSEEDTNDQNDNNYNALPEASNYFVVENKGEDEVYQQDDKIQVIQFNQIKRQVNRLPKKKHQNHCRIKNVNFKYKKLLKKEETANKRQACAAKYKETFYTNDVSKAVSRATLLKSVVAKENILDNMDAMISDEENNNNDSLTSSPSTTKKSLISYSSDDTLTRQTSIGTISSVIKIPSQRVMPYKTEVINVSVAVAYNPNNNNEHIQSSERQRPRNLVSTETLVEPGNFLASDSVSSENSENFNFLKLQSMNVSESSDKTLKPNSDNTYTIGNTSSEGDDSLKSESTLAPNSEMFIYAESLRQTPPDSNTEKERPYNRTALLDTVINMGIFPEIIPSTSSAVNFNNEFNNVFVTGDSSKFLKKPIYEGKHFLEIPKDKNSKYVLKKSFGVNNESNHLKNVNLPNECTIKAIINKPDMIKNEFWSGEPRHYPKNITDLWDRLVVVVDDAVKRLENSLTQKIIDEIRKSLPPFEPKQKAPEKEETYVTDVEKSQGDKVFSHKEVFVEKNDFKIDVDESLQCSLVGNQVIDNIMLKLSVEGPECTTLPKTKRPKIFRDYFEVLKPPTVASAVVEGKDNTVTVSTASTPSEIQEIGSFSRVKTFFAGPLTFLRENMFVLTSVPSFFVMLLCVYGVIVLIMKPW